MCSAEPQVPDIPVSAEARQWITDELRRGTLTPGRPLLRLIRGNWISAVSRDVRASGGERRGILVLISMLDLGVAAMPPGAVLTIVDRAGVVIARSSQPERWVGRDVSRSGVGRIALREREGRMEATGIDGTSRQYGFTTVPEVGWHLYVGIPTAEAMQPVRALFVRGAAGGSIDLSDLRAVLASVAHLTKQTRRHYMAIIDIYKWSFAERAPDGIVASGS